MAEIVTLDEAVAELVHDGDTVALEGFTHLIPHAAGHELIRQGRRDLTLVRMTPDVVYDQMIGMGCARKLVFSWGGNPGVGSLHRLRDAVEHGWPAPLELEEHSHAGMAAAYAAGAANLPFGVAARLRGHRPRRRTRASPGSTARSPASGWRRCRRCGPTSASSTRSAPTGGQRPAVGDQRRAEGGVLASARSLVTVEEIVRRARAAPGRGRPARRWAVTAVAVGAGRRAPVLRARLLRPRQRLLRALGRDQPRPRPVRGVDAAPRARDRRRRRVPARLASRPHDSAA